ncbi:unnamed protein product [Urochloa humidicola]
MAWRRLQLVITLAVAMATATATLSVAQKVQPAAAAAAFFPTLPSCPPAPLSLSPCIGYVFGVSTATLTACCSQLRSFLRAQAPCLCAASKPAPSPVGLLIGQAQNIIPNVCHLPDPCDDAAAGDGDGEGSAPAAASTPSVAGTAPPSETATTTPAATTTTPATEEPTSSTTAAADPGASVAPAEPAEDNSPAGATAPDGAGSKLPQLLHAAGATSSRGMAAGTVFTTVFLASVAAMYV